MHLTDLCAGVSGAAPPAINPDIIGLTADSRNVDKGYLFAALPGTQSDGRAYIKEAVSRGAAAILAPDGTGLPEGAGDIALITASNPRRELALIAARFYGNQPETAAAVTGTNGKTSVAWFTRRLWSALGHKAASIGTLGTDLAGEKPSLSGLTTADPVALHAQLRGLADDGIDHVVLEASSHGLDQARLDGVQLSAGAFTNLSRDHLDYHGTMEAYRTAKERLFTELLPSGATAVLNADAGEFSRWQKIAGDRSLKVLSYGIKGEALRLEKTVPRSDGQDVTVEIFGVRHELSLAVPGAFQAANLLCALGLAIACGDDADDVINAVSAIEAPPGRMELAGRLKNGGSVYIDFAHTPDALHAVLTALRPHTKGRLAVVFGCGGDRDRGKRPEMGAIAVSHADDVIVTDDNPRSEDPAAIRAEIVKAAPGAVEIGDRAEAIRAGISGLGPDDILVIAGKGHETGQIVGTETLPFNDMDTARAVLEALS